MLYTSEIFKCFSMHLIFSKTSNIIISIKISTHFLLYRLYHTWQYEISLRILNKPANSKLKNLCFELKPYTKNSKINQLLTHVGIICWLSSCIRSSSENQLEVRLHYHLVGARLATNNRSLSPSKKNTTSFFMLLTWFWGTL